MAVPGTSGEDPSQRSGESASLGAHRFGACTDDALVATIEQLHGLACAVTAQLLAVTDELTHRDAWSQDGACSPAEGLAHRLGWELRSARAFVATAERLRELPAIFERFADGSLSWDQLRPLARLARPETDEHLSTEGQRATPASLQRAARSRELATEPASAPEQRRRLSWRTDPRRGEGRFSMTLPLDQALVLARSVDAVLGRAAREGADDVGAPLAARRVDALLEMLTRGGEHTGDGPGKAEQAGRVGRAGAMGAPPAEVLIVTDPALTLAHLEDGTPVHPELARLHACSGPVASADDPDPAGHRNEAGDRDGAGHANGAGHADHRATRRPSTRLLRTLRRRDQARCRFPGCARRSFLQAHHIVHWPDGPTRAANLVLLCSGHHRRLHLHGWRIEGNPAGEITVVIGDRRVGEHHPRARLEVALLARFGLPPPAPRRNDPDQPPEPLN